MTVQGRAGEVDFTFACHRCGHCCTVPDGYVWLAEGEVEALARETDSDVEAFRRRAVRSVPDPRSGEVREALRDGFDGRCVLLEGAQHCSAYAARPEHCRAFPFWDSVLSGGDGFERARRICPGIEVQPSAEARSRAFEALEALYAELDNVVKRSHSVCLARGLCCRFEEAGHELYSTGLEADYAAHHLPDAPEPEAEGRCPYHQSGRCTARSARPIGCRTYFCDPQTTDAMQAVHEDFLARLRTIEREAGYPPSYGRFPAFLAQRGVGVPPDGVTPTAGEGSA